MANWTVFQICLAVLMVVTGSINTLAAKWADRLEAEGKTFNHPFLQALCMFIGESLCLVAFVIVYLFRKYRYRRARVDGDLGRIDELDDAAEPTIPRFNVLIFLPPACCDILATSIMYVGLNMTHASSFQMLRGAVIIFTGLLSVAFLRTIMRGFQWLGMGLVMSGLIVVGIADIALGTDSSKDDINSVITGDLLIIMAQIIVAIQMVYEQKYVMKYDVPALLAVGLEGIYGMAILTVLMYPMYYIHLPRTFSENPFGRMEDVWLAFKQMGEDPLIIVALSGTITSIAFFNFAGISVTKELSATTRMVLDSVRTLVIWAVCLGLGWQTFVWLQIVGFGLLILGMFIYNDLVIGPWFRRSVLPAMSERGMDIGCCLSCCGVEDNLDDQRTLIHSEERDAHN
uniref:Solute carrier family 35 member F6 n=1 Tax=Plectus sambesii TaxID=2011161 RepID=A0A914X1T1_9BILA